MRTRRLHDRRSTAAQRERRVSAHVPGVVHEALVALSRHNGLPMSVLIEEALRQFGPLRAAVERAIAPPRVIVLDAYRRARSPR